MTKDEFVVSVPAKLVEIAKLCGMVEDVNPQRTKAEADRAVKQIDHFGAGLHVIFCRFETGEMATAHFVLKITPQGVKDFSWENAPHLAAMPAAPVVPAPAAKPPEPPHV